jgi:hypothetical protein
MAHKDETCSGYETENKTIRNTVAIDGTPNIIENISNMMQPSKVKRCH